MEKTLTALTDLITVVFNLAIYAGLTRFKKDNFRTRCFAYVSCTVILVFYFLCTYVWQTAAAVATLLCMTIPSFVVFGALSEYRDARFVFTFCFADTIALSGASLARILFQWTGPADAWLGFLIVLVMYLAIYLKGRKYFPVYHELQETGREGWGSLMASAIMIYALLLFAAGYPQPLIERPEYTPVYAAILLTILSFYVVFIVMLFQKKKLNDLNIQLLQEKKWHDIAFVDPLTRLNNRMAYMEYINQVERMAEEKEQPVYAVMIDVDDFKRINDTLGHYIGDQMLKEAAKQLEDAFKRENYKLFRIGGDEFAVIAIDVTQTELAMVLDGLNCQKQSGEKICSFSIGSSKVVFSQHNAMEKAFIRADQAMYEAKAQKKV